MSQRKIKVPGPLLIVDADKLSDLQPSDILVFSVQHHMNPEMAGKVRSNIEELLAMNDLTNRFIVLTPHMMLHVLRLEP